MKRVPVLWFTADGLGPDEMAIELHPFAADLDGAIPAKLGLRVRSAGLVIQGASMVGGGFYLGREQVLDLCEQMSEWLEPGPIADPVSETAEKIASWIESRAAVLEGQGNSLASTVKSVAEAIRADRWRQEVGHG